MIYSIVMFFVKGFVMRFLSEKMTKDVAFEIAERITSWTPTEKDDLLVKLAKDNMETIDKLTEDK